MESDSKPAPLRAVRATRTARRFVILQRDDRTGRHQLTVRYDSREFTCYGLSEDELARNLIAAWFS
jgi:hypothetical protein